MLRVSLLLLLLLSWTALLPVAIGSLPIVGSRRSSGIGFIRAALLARLQGNCLILRARSPVFQPLHQIAQILPQVAGDIRIAGSNRHLHLASAFADSELDAPAIFAGIEPNRYLRSTGLRTCRGRGRRWGDMPDGARRVRVGSP